MKEFASRREGDFWDEWKERWVWQNSEEAAQLKTAMDLWEVEIHKAIKQSRTKSRKICKINRLYERNNRAFTERKK